MTNAIIFVTAACNKLKENSNFSLETIFIGFVQDTMLRLGDIERAFHFQSFLSQ